MACNVGFERFGGVFRVIESQVATDIVAMDKATVLLGAWPLVFSMAMIYMFLAAFCISLRAAALIATAVHIISYFGSNLIGIVSSVEPFEPLFLHTYLVFKDNALY